MAYEKDKDGIIYEVKSSRRPVSLENLQSRKKMLMKDIETLQSELDAVTSMIDSISEK